MHPLQSVHAIRVIGEFMVLRLYLLHFSIGMDMFVREIMSFFYVWTGFVTMYTYYDSSFMTLDRVKSFLMGQWWKVYPTYLVNWSCHLPGLVIFGIHYSIDNDCILRIYCSFMQLFMVDCWAGCGIKHTGDNLSWHISSMCWLLFFFPALKDWIQIWFQNRVWIKMVVIGLISTGMLYPFMEFDIFTICTLPILRAGEFVVGCGAACALCQYRHQASALNLQLTKHYWIPVIIPLGGIAAMYSFLGSKHGMGSICLHQQVQSSSCSLWSKSPFVEESPPCYTLGDKYVNKNCVAWATVIYYIAKADLAEDKGWVMTVLKHDFFKFLSEFSPTLFLCHSGIAMGLKWSASELLAWDEKWHDDILVIMVYSISFLLHHVIQMVTHMIHPTGNSTAEDLCSSMPLIPPRSSDTEGAIDGEIIEAISVISDTQTQETMHPDDY